MTRATRNALNMTLTPHTTTDKRDKSALNFSRRVHPCGNRRKTCEMEAGAGRMEDDGRRKTVDGRPFLPLPLQVSIICPLGWSLAQTVTSICNPQDGNVSVRTKTYMLGCVTSRNISSRPQEVGGNFSF